MSESRSESQSESLSEAPAASLDAVLPQILGELRVLARRELAREHIGHTLQTTDLIHEAYLRLAEDQEVVQRGRAYFWASAARAMRQVLVDAARKRQANKRGGGVPVLRLDDLSLDEAPRVTDTLGDELLALDAALAALEKRNSRHARVVECRFFGGMSVDDTAAALSVSPRTVKSDWALARAWLYDVLHAEDR